MTTPADFPPIVAPGELITSAWGNDVAGAISMKLAWATLTRLDVNLGSGGADVLVTLTGLTGVVDPLTLITTNGLQIPAAWAGLWDVRWMVRTRFGTSPTSDVQIDAFVQVGSTKSSIHASGNKFSSDDIVAIGASDFVVIPPAGGLIQLYANSSYTGAVSGVDFAMSAAWRGKGLP